MFERHLWKSDILSKDAGHRPVFFFILSGLLVSGTLVKNGLRHHVPKNLY